MFIIHLFIYYVLFHLILVNFYIKYYFFNLKKTLTKIK